MSRFFTAERFGRAQLLAAALIAAFATQACWLILSELHSSDPPSQNLSQQLRVAEGWRQLHRQGIAGAPFHALPANLPLEISQDADGFDSEHSPLLSLLTAAPLLLAGRDSDPTGRAYAAWLPRLPFLAFGIFLAASLWYVARRLCGNTGGLVALTLYCFSPSMIQASSVWHTEPEILSAWGSFGAIFTAIAVAHTLYAPREVVLWNWRRIVLLGTALAIAIGSQFSMIVVAPFALAFLLHLAPIRRGAALLIWAAACAVAFLLLLAVYFFDLHAFSAALHHASFWGATWRGFTVPGVYLEIARQIVRACPALAVLLPAALLAYLCWPRSRYFGNTAPALVALVFLSLAMAHPHEAGAGFLLASTPFLLIFVSGVLADLMETRSRMLVTACVGGLLAAYILWNVVAIIQVPKG